MKHQIVLIFTLFISIFSYSQQNLLVQESGKISILNYDSKVERDCFECWDFKEKTVLEKNERQLFVGYSLQKDSLNVYLRQSGKIIEKRYRINPNLNPSTEIIEFKVSNKDALYRPKEDPYVIYKYENIKLVSRSGGQMKCYLDTTLLWTKKCKVKIIGCVIVGGGCWNPVLCPNKEKILMRIDGKLVEVDVKTGEERIISKKGGTYYEYSQEGRYILFRKDGRINIYDKLNGKNNKYITWTNAFWIYK